MNNSNLLKQYNYFQRSAYGHKLTCLCGSKLVPTITEPNFYLQCPDCDWIQPVLPKIPTIERMKEMEQSAKDMMEQMFQSAIAEEPEPEDKVQTREISYTVTFEVKETLEFDPADWDEDMDTMDKYQAYQMESKMDYAEEMFHILDDYKYNISNVKVIK